MLVCQYITWYALFAFLGWVYECVLNMVREGAWENRGFLFGPSCPIYGVGVVAFLIAFDRPQIADGSVPAWGVFLISMCAATVLEYATSVAMERLFHARWWDYGNTPLNLDGRICLPASVLFGLGGVGTAFVLVPFTHCVVAVVPAWVFELVAVAVTALVAVDATLSFSALTELLQKVEEKSDEFDQLMGDGFETFKRGSAAAAGRLTTPLVRAHVSFSIFNALTFGRFTALLPASKKDAGDQMREFVEGLSSRQRRVMASIKGFSDKGATALGYSARKAMHELNKIAGRGGK